MRYAPPPPALPLTFTVQDSVSKTGHDKPDSMNERDKPDSMNERDKPVFTCSHQPLNKIGT